MTGQDLLNRMELVNAELQLQSGEENVTKGLLALNVAQDYFESLAAARPNMFSGTVATVTTAANTESTTFPSTLLRIDRLQLINATTSRPESELRRITRTGGHAVTTFWPLNIVATTGSGKPRAYWTNGTSIYWQPLPDAVYTVRYYGMTSRSDLTAAGAFAYPDIVAMPMAVFATKLYKLGLDDDPSTLSALAEETFNPVLRALERFNRDGALGYEYTRIHTE